MTRVPYRQEYTERYAARFLDGPWQGQVKAINVIARFFDFAEAGPDGTGLFYRSYELVSYEERRNYLTVEYEWIGHFRLVDEARSQLLAAGSSLEDADHQAPPTPPTSPEQPEAPQADRRPPSPTRRS